MNFVARDSVTGKYVSWKKDKIELKTLAADAKKFRNQEHWIHFRDSQLGQYCKRKNVDIDRFGIICNLPKKAANEIFQPWGSEIMENYESEADLQKYAEGENMEKEKNIEHMTFSTEAAPKSTKSPFDGGLNMEELLYLLNKLPQFVGVVSPLADNFQAAMDLCYNEIKREDIESMDIAHKIEFAVVNVVEGYRLYKEFHDCRLRRRKAKDTLELLQLIDSSGIMDGIRKFTEKYGAYKFKLENRTYHPRIRDDLFQDEKKKKEGKEDDES